MAKYRFPFDTVRRVKALQRDEQRQRLADAFRAQDIVEHQQQQLGTELSELQNQQRQDLNREHLNVNDLLAAQRYELVLNVQQQTLEKQSAMLAEEAERRRQSLVEAERGVQVMEKLDGRLQAAHQVQERRTETKQLDEIAQQRATSRRR
ncbi:MAG: flagellar FliJ family protein [Pirellulales bacterium]